MNTFKSYGTKAIGVTKTIVYTAPILTTSTVIGLSIANIISTVANVDVSLFKGATEIFLVKGSTVSPGGALVIVGGDQKVVIEAGNTIKVVSSVALGVDVLISVLEVS